MQSESPQARNQRLSRGLVRSWNGLEMDPREVLLDIKSPGIINQCTSAPTASLSIICDRWNEPSQAYEARATLQMSSRMATSITAQDTIPLLPGGRPAPAMRRYGFIQLLPRYRSDVLLHLFTSWKLEVADYLRIPESNRDWSDFPRHNMSSLPSYTNT
ncbi:hypothetical protein F4776DRAFT_97583 [Hypoxylon sp. NC0597]|nr:hypothetical protein F4776DRAFT_97583 [Hypoxylon sp. NC0597]